MSHNQGIRRQFIEGVRQAFLAMGVEIHRHQANTNKKITHGDILNALIELRFQNIHQEQANEELRFLNYCSLNLLQSHSQLLQDLFVLFECHSEHGGYFVDFGATDGVQINNTILLEREYGWTGVVAEPARCWHERLQANRHCFVSTDCVWRSSGETLVFNETEDRELSTIDKMTIVDGHSKNRVNGERYAVRSISLMDLLRQADAPKVIDYMSIDTEGSEFEILNAFDFNAYDIRVITVEHNYTPAREQLHDLLSSKGFVRKFSGLSQWDGWYVSARS